MRISSDKDDPGFTPDIWRFDCYFDGEVQCRATGREIVTADEEMGFIIFLRCSDGLILDMDEAGIGYARSTAYGTVKIVARISY